MGEYAENASGHRIKLGTCEDLMYVTRQDIEALGAAGWKDDNDQNVRSYLDIEACRVALPRLYDVAGDVARIEAEKPEFPHRYRINLDAATVEMLRDIDHSDIYFHKAGTNFFVPCPMGQKWDKSIKSSQIHHHIDLVAEGLGKKPRAVYQCPYCGAKFNLRGHASQLAVLQLFYDQWTMGGSKLPERQAKYLENLIGACDIPQEATA